MKWKTMEQCLQNSENKYFYYIYMSNQPLSEEWEEKGHFQMCQVLEATVACPSHFMVKRKAGRPGDRAQEGRRPTAIWLLVRGSKTGLQEGQHQGE